MTTDDQPQPDPLQRQADALLRRADRCPADSLQPLTGGGNNRVFRVETADGPLLLKQYYRHGDDPRDRLAHEFAFSGFAWGRGLRCVPEPLAHDDVTGLGLYGFVPGRMLEPDEVTAARVDEAIAFFRALNAPGDDDSAAAGVALPSGSEACFSNLEHVALVDQRVRRLDAISDPGAAAFVEGELKPAWAAIHPKLARAGDALAPAPRCVSPSDFGFHNALWVQTPGTYAGLSDALIFHDFEYAGWDDPAKLLGDFFHQPRRPAPGDCYPAFEDAVIEALGLDDAQRDRFRRLLPVYRIKWCGIILAPLLPGAAQRRKYAGVEIDPRTVVERARTLLHQPLTPDH